MSSKIFKIGDVVELKSGGPKITVEDVKQQYDNGKPLDGFDCKCVWFVDTELKTEWFDEQSLKSYIPYQGDQSNRIN
ncbi:MAG: DUF2158 domain-containing protein [Saprospiraceae bacterium]|nr:DUF2158 domain-containing protein [Saprospiraceae bacterium]